MFCESDFKCSEKVVQSQEQEVVIVASATKTLLAVCLLAAAKLSMKKDNNGCLCVFENVHVFEAFLEKVGGTFTGLKFVQNLKQLKFRTICYLGNLENEVNFNNATVIILNGSASFVKKASEKMPSITKVIYAVNAPIFDKFWNSKSPDFVTLEADNLELEISPLPQLVRTWVDTMESEFDVFCAELSRNQLIFPSACVFRMIPATCLDMSINKLKVSEQFFLPLKQLVVLDTAKRFLEKLGGESVATSLEYLQVSFEHPFYGTWK